MSAQNIGAKVPKYGPAIPAVGLLWSALRAAGEKIELSFLTGISGAAFRTCIDHEGHDDVLWLEGARVAENALPVLGYELHFIAHTFPQGTAMTPEQREKWFLETQLAIDGGTPVLLTGSFGWALILGYDKGQRQYWLRQVSPWNAVHNMSRCPPWDVGAEQEERWEEEDLLAGLEKGIALAVLRKRGKPLPKHGLAMHALKHAVSHANQKTPGPKYMGLNAIEYLSTRLAREAETPKWQPHICGASLPMQIVFCALNRSIAVSFLKEAAADFSGAKRSSLDGCASFYGQAAQEWLLLQSSLPNPQAYYESKQAVKQGPDLMRHMSESLRKIIDLERRAIHELEAVV